MVLNRTEQKAMDRYPERFDHNLNDSSGGWSSKYGLFTKVTEPCQGRCEFPKEVKVLSRPDGYVQCECIDGNVFSIVADDAATFHEQVKDMGHCECCGTWFQDPATS